MNNKPKIFFFCKLKSNIDKASLRGGDKVYLQHLEILRSLGYLSYFVTDNSIRDHIFPIKKTADELFISEKQFISIFNPTHDYVVIPGRFLDRLDEYPGRNKILFIQGVYITLNSVDLNKPRESTWESKSLKGIFCVSEANAEIVRAMEPTCPVYVIPNSIQPNFNEEFLKQNLLLYPNLKQAEKNPLDTNAILNQLHTYCSRNQPKENYDFLELRGLSHNKVLERMKTAKVLLFLGLNEGLPLTILEAMANDVIIIAYNRRPMSDLIHPNCIFEVHQFKDMIRSIYSILFEHEKWLYVIEWNRKKVLEYSSEKQNSALRKTWSNLITNSSESTVN